MKFKKFKTRLIKGLASYYKTVDPTQESAGYQVYMNLEECTCIEDVIENMEAQGFGQKDNEPLAWWILFFVVKQSQKIIE